MKMTDCFKEGCGKPAPYGLRLPGLLSEQKRGGYLWHCLEHEADALSRRNKAMGVRQENPRDMGIKQKDPGDEAEKKQG